MRVVFSPEARDEFVEAERYYVSMSFNRLRVASLAGTLAIGMLLSS
jgi:hypothetical protein